MTNCATGSDQENLIIGRQHPFSWLKRHNIRTFCFYSQFAF
ncbi:Uncharacterized protein dnm_080180 [Desulfonema magnum]|uniref:Uncharacterized protein n=1 Tax=Desulfonema magnum TaxID=45655 RepID=A0A975BVM2_9BACT|nr:Uncharacterized protein dnm_080180 [Desulfonema magnum]